MECGPSSGFLEAFFVVAESGVKAGNIPCEYRAVGVWNRRALRPECVVIVALRFTQICHNRFSHFLFHARLRIGHKIPTGHHNAYNASSSSFVHPDLLFPPHDTALSWQERRKIISPAILKTSTATPTCGFGRLLRGRDERRNEEGMIFLIRDFSLMALFSQGGSITSFSITNLPASAPYFASASSVSSSPFAARQEPLRLNHSRKTCIQRRSPTRRDSTGCDAKCGHLAHHEGPAQVCPSLRLFCV